MKYTILPRHRRTKCNFVDVAQHAGLKDPKMITRWEQGVSSPDKHLHAGKKCEERTTPRQNRPKSKKAIAKQDKTKWDLAAQLVAELFYRQVRWEREHRDRENGHQSCDV